MESYWHLWFDLDVKKLAAMFNRPAHESAPLVSQMMEDVGNRLVRQNVTGAFGFLLRPGGAAQMGASVGEIRMVSKTADSTWLTAVSSSLLSFEFVLPTYTIKHPETISRLLKGIFDQIARKLDAHALTPQPFPWKFEDATGQPVGQIHAEALAWLTAPKMMAFEGSFKRDTQQELSVTVHATSRQEAEVLLRQAAHSDADWVDDDYLGDPELHTISEGMEIVPAAPNPNEQAVHAILNRPGFDVTLRRTVIQEITYRVGADEASTPEAAQALAENIMAQGDSQVFEDERASSLWQPVSMDAAVVARVEKFNGYDANPTQDESANDVGLPRPSA